MPRGTHLDDAMRERIMALVRAGVRESRIASSLGLCLDTVARVRKRAGIFGKRGRRPGTLAGLSVQRQSLQRQVHRSEPPAPEALAARERALAVPLSAEMIVLGDPPPGRSALDCLRAANGQEPARGGRSALDILRAANAAEGNP
jgi:hypothetical protein